MKKIFYYIVPLVLLAACEPESTSTLAKLRLEKDSLSVVQKDLNNLIKSIDDQIEELDSTSNLHTVSVYNLERKNFKHYFKVYGKVESNQSISLYSETSGRIDKISVRRGQKVKQGQLLASIDATVIEQNIAEIKTSLDLANKIYNVAHKVEKMKLQLQCIVVFFLLRSV